MDSTRGAGTLYPSGAHEFVPVFRGVRVARSFVFCVVFCRSLFVLFSFDQCIVCASSINGVLSLWYLQAF
jgi:cadmium resistance protein CadD (predicted permease)